VTGVWRKLHIEELHNLYSSPSIIRMIKLRSMRWAGHLAHLGKNKNAYRVLTGKPERKRSLGRHSHGWEHDIKMYHKEVGWGGMDWIDLAQDTDQ
jgi:hypothetical protein